jgi:hypothetical protein
MALVPSLDFTSKITLRWEVNHLTLCWMELFLIFVIGANIVAQQFGAATTSADMMEGIMGVGWGYGLDTSYYNIIDQLAVQGITHSRAFSLNLASIDVVQGMLSTYFLFLKLIFQDQSSLGVSIQ